MKLIIVRHGETVENVSRIIQGQTHGKLTRKGISQAKKLAKRLKNEKIDVIFSSDLGRARDTAKEIAKYHKVKIKYSKLLREKSHGIFDGGPSENWINFKGKKKLPPISFRPEGGENFYDLNERAKKFLKEIKNKYKDKTVLIVSHGGLIRMLLGNIMKIPIKIAFGMTQLNCCVNLVEIKGKDVQVHSINCIKHL